MKIIGSYLEGLQQTLADLPQESVAGTIDVLHEARVAGRQVYRQIEAG